MNHKRGMHEEKKRATFGDSAAPVLPVSGRDCRGDPFGFGN